MKWWRSLAFLLRFREYSGKQMIHVRGRTGNRFLLFHFPNVSSPHDIERKKELIIFGSCPKLSRIKMELTTWMDHPPSSLTLSSIFCASQKFHRVFQFNREKRLKESRIFAKLGCFILYFFTTLPITKANIFLCERKKRATITRQVRSTNIAIPFVCTPVSEPLHAIRKNSNVFVSVVA